MPPPLLTARRRPWTVWLALWIAVFGALAPTLSHALAILLVGGDKGGADQRRFYKRLIAVADERFDEHLATLIT